MLVGAKSARAIAYLSYMADKRAWYTKGYMLIYSYMRLDSYNEGIVQLVLPTGELGRGREEYYAYVTVSLGGA